MFCMQYHLSFALHVICCTELTVVHLSMKMPSMKQKSNVFDLDCTHLLSCLRFDNLLCMDGLGLCYSLDQTLQCQEKHFVFQFDSIWWFTLLCMCSMSFQRDIYDIIDNKILWHLSKTPCSPKILIHRESNCKLLKLFRILPFK